MLATAERRRQVPQCMATLGRTDLFFLIVRLLNRRDVDRDWLYYRCLEVAAAPDGYLDLWAREHYKSTIITFGLTIQDILNDPELTSCIFSHSRPIAKGFLRQIKGEFERNDLLHSLYPDVLYSDPKKMSPKWSEDDGIVVKRKANPKEATLEAWGLVDGQPTSKHYSLAIYDDVVTKESVSTPEMIKKVNDSWELSLALHSDGGRVRYIGTRYHFADTYKTILDRKAAIERRHPGTTNGKMTGDPVLFSKRYNDEKRERMGSYVYSCQILQDPKADDTMSFKQEWLRYYNNLHTVGMNRYLIVDPASSKKKGSDYTVMLIIGVAQDRNYYLLDGVRDRLSLTERAMRLFGLHQKWRPNKVGYEKYGKDSDIEHIQDQMDRRTYHFDIVELAGTMSKVDRILRLVPVFEFHHFFLPKYLYFRDYTGFQRDLILEFVNEEYSGFPVASHDDILDCVARVLDPELGVEFPISDADLEQIGDLSEADDGDWSPLKYFGRRG
jgi:predicted phage terminase large subunit-like protein